MKSEIVLFFHLVLFSGIVSAQSAVVVAGGDAQTNEGTMSNSIGQIAIDCVSNTDFIILEGIQQPFEIMVLGTDSFPEIQLSAIIYPNPVVNKLHLIIKDNFQEHMNYGITDISGKLILKAKPLQQETDINFENYVPGIYFLSIIQKNKVLKTFKIIKN